LLSYTAYPSLIPSFKAWVAIAFSLLLILSCEKEENHYLTSAIDLPIDQTVRSIKKYEDFWLITGGSKGENGFVLRSHDNLQSFETLTDSLYEPVYDQAYARSRYYFPSDKIQIYSSPPNLDRFWIYYPPEEYWVNTLNKKVNRKIEVIPDKGLLIACGADFGKGVVFFSPIDVPHWIPFEVDHEIRDVAFQPNGNMWACGYGIVLKSADGLNWENRGMNNRFYTGMDFRDQQTGLLSTFDGNIYRTDDGGNSWKKVYSSNGNHSESINGIAFIREGVALAYGNGGLVMLSSDEGKGWHKLQNIGEVDLYNYELNGSTVYLVGNSPHIFKLEL
jgi:hypothetical protein